LCATEHIALAIRTAETTKNHIEGFESLGVVSSCLFSSINMVTLVSISWYR